MIEWTEYNQSIDLQKRINIALDLFLPKQRVQYKNPEVKHDADVIFTMLQWLKNEIDYKLEKGGYLT